QIDKARYIMCSEVAELKSMYQFVGTYILEPAACLWIHGLSFDRRQFNLRTKMEGCYKSVGEVIIVIKNNGKAGKLSTDQFLDARVLLFQDPGHFECREIIAAAVDQVKMRGIQLLPLLRGTVLGGIELSLGNAVDSTEKEQ